MKDHGQQARASENFAGPEDFETPRPDLPVHFLNFQKPWLAVVFHKPWSQVRTCLQTGLKLVKLVSSRYLHTTPDSQVLPT